MYGKLPKIDAAMISFVNVDCTFGGRGGIAEASFALNQGEFLFLTGPSGSGKSTILRLIYMDLFPEKGRVIFRNYSSHKIRTWEIPYLRRRIGMVFQDFRLLRDRTVFQNVALSLYVSRYKTREIKRRVHSVLEQVGLGDRVYYRPEELSGGEQQRVVIARALIKEPDVILADEPTGNLDQRVSLGLMNLLQKINEGGTAVIFATHNYSLIPRIPGARLMQLDNGQITRLTE